jgi:hypothetical protein
VVHGAPLHSICDLFDKLSKQLLGFGSPRPHLLSRILFAVWPVKYVIFARLREGINE